MAKTVGGVVIDQAHRLHIGITDGGADKPEARFVQLF
jgi:hypothetical protein